ncbi:MAG TPA: flagellin [Bacteroidota bacterium]|nr:flagellin [Bacteroidota bacterium]
MAYSSGARINTNIAAYNALNALNNANRQLGIHQLRLATGKRINSAGDDPSGYVISKKLEGRSQALSAALQNVGDANSVFSVAEGGYQTINDILVQIKAEQTRAANGAMGTDELTAIADEINQQMTEIDDTNDQTKFNGNVLMKKDAAATAFNATFQIGEAATETLGVTFSQTTGATALLGVAAGSVTAANIASLTVDTGIQTVSGALGSIGAMESRLSDKETNLNTAITNTDAAQSQIMDADVAKEQIDVVKDQFLQQTATAQLAQANQTPSVFLSLFR